MVKRRFTRRELLHELGLWTAGGLVMAHPVKRRVPASERIAVGVIGAGVIAQTHVAALLGQTDVQIVAVCDVQDRPCQTMVNWINGHYQSRVCRGYRDYREVLARPDVDAVFICTPDHWHAQQTIDAAQSGKHCYCEKPMARTVAECRAMVDAVRSAGIVFQHGTQQRSDPLFRHACELVRNGRIGKVHTVRVAVEGNSARGWGTPKQPPADVDWNMWLGPAPWAPYSDERIDRLHWFFIQDYSAGGYMSGWGIHHVDIAQWGLGMDHAGPETFEGTGVFARDGMADTPLTWHVECEYPGGVRMIFTTLNEAPFGVRFEGSDGTIFVHRGEFWTQPAHIGKELLGPDETRLYRSDNHHRNFFDCIRNRRSTVAPVEVAYHSQLICSLSDIAIRLGRKIRWDHGKQCVVNDPEANRLLHRASRVWQS